MKSKTLLSIFLFSCATMVFAQPQLPTQVKARKPELLSSGKPQMMDELQREFRNGSNWGQNKKAKPQAWVVYSDREHNTTYTTPDKAKRFGELMFGEKVNIAEIKGDMALVYIDEKNRYPDIPSNAKCKGWVPMENLLLWDRCPTDQRGVLKKGIIAINLNKMSKDEKFQAKKYYSPDNLSQSSALNTDMNFYYVMKETDDGEFALLTTGAMVSNPQLFYGWINKNAYTEWNQRSCLEPNWLPKFVETHEGQRVYVYEDESCSSIATHWEYGASNGDSNPLYKYRMPKDQLRFPILSQPNDKGVVLCTSFADRTKKSINEAAKFVGSISGMANNIGKQIMQMNVIIAVEATTEMGKYMPAVKDALTTCKDYAQQGLSVQVGLVLYGSLSEGASGVTVVPLGNYDDARLLSMLDASQSGSQLNSERNVSLTQAIENAVSSTKMGFKKEQSNLLLVVGYHGTDEGSWNEKSLLDKLVANNIQLASIQVMRTSSGSCKRYFDQMEDIVRKNVELQYKSIGAEAVFQNAKDKNGKLSNDGYLFKSSQSANKGGNPLFASARYNKVQDQEMSPQDLTRYVSNGISGFAKSVSTSKSVYEEALADVDFYPDFLIKKLGQKGYEAWKQVKAISAYGGYARVEGLGKNDEWQAILYLSADELKGTIERLRPISVAAKEQNPNRTKFVDAIKALLKAQLGGSIPDSEINEMSPEELENAIYGIVNVKSENMRFTRFSLSDLVNKKTVSDDDYFDMLDRFEKKYQKLSNITKGYDYRMEVGPMYYYWIPLEDLP